MLVTQFNPQFIILIEKYFLHLTLRRLIPEIGNLKQVTIKYYGILLIIYLVNEVLFIQSRLPQPIPSEYFFYSQHILPGILRRGEWTLYNRETFLAALQV